MLAEGFRYKLPGTQRPPNLDPSLPWSGEYASSDGQLVTDEDARQLTSVLGFASTNAALPRAIGDIIARIEADLTAEGIKIPDAMRLQPEALIQGLPAVVAFISRGAFFIE
jgi:hypothetical protein